MEKTVISLDVGGTFVKYGVVNQCGSILFQDKIPTIEDKNDKFSIIKSAHKAVEELNNKYPETEAICISTAGIVNDKTGVIEEATGDFINLIGFDIKSYFEQNFHKTTVAENDANCAAFAEKWCGAAENLNDFMLVTIGTGIGGGIFADGKLVRGCGGGGEIGHFRTVYNGLQCSCGGKGCYERYASMNALIKQVFAQTGLKLNGYDILDRYRSKDTLIVPIVKQWICYLSEGIISLMHIFNPQAVLIGGGVSSNEEVIEEIKDYIKMNAMKYYVKDVRIEQALAGNDAGMIGAAYLYFQKLKAEQQPK